MVEQVGISNWRDHFPLPESIQDYQFVDWLSKLDRKSQTIIERDLLIWIKDEIRSDAFVSQLQGREREKFSDTLHSIIGNLDSVRHEQRWEYPLADNREWRGMGVRLFYDEVGVELIEEKIATIKEYE